jgi:hypothetical protein
MTCSSRWGGRPRTAATDCVAPAVAPEPRTCAAGTTIFQRVSVYSTAYEVTCAQYVTPESGSCSSRIIGTERARPGGPVVVCTLSLEGELTRTAGSVSERGAEGGATG